MTAPAFQTAERGARGGPPRLPPLRDVLLEQVRATGFALRNAAVTATALLTLITIATLLQKVSLGAIIDLYSWPTLLPGLIGALLPIAVWARDERFGPSFLWTLPVDRRRHALTKVLAGWVWLMGGVAVFALWLLALNLLSGSRVLPPYTLQLLTSPLDATAALDATTLRAVSWAPGPLIWVVPFTAATAAYLLASAFALGSRHPLRWGIGIVLVYLLSALAGDAANARLNVGWVADAPSHLLHLLIESRHGVDALFTARTGTLSTTATLTTGERALVWRAVPDLADWRTATLLWTGAGVIALWAGASRHRERRRA
jgi:hypothetical protein